MTEVGAEIRRLRRARGWTGAQLAVYAGMAPSAISQIETARRNPNAGSLEKIAKALKVEVVDLFPKDRAQLLEERGFLGEQIAARLAEDEREKELIARELEKMSPKELREQIIAISPALRRYYREHPPQAGAPASRESA